MVGIYVYKTEIRLIPFIKTDYIYTSYKYLISQVYIFAHSIIFSISPFSFLNKNNVLL